MSNAPEKKFISAVIYLHNEKERAARFLKFITKALGENFETYELIIVDDASDDGSAEEVCGFFKQDMRGAQQCSIVHMGYYHGLEASMNAGRDMAIGDFVYEFDDMIMDYSEDLIMEIYRHLLKGYDIVSAGSSGRAKLSSKLFYRVFNAASGARNKIGPETFRILSRRAINRIGVIGKYIPYRKAVEAGSGLKTDSIRYTPAGEDAGRSHYVRTDRMDLALDSFIYFTGLMEKISLVISVIFLAITVIVFIDILIEFFGRSSAVSGWISTMGFLSLGFMGVFLMLTIIMKYLSALLNLSFRRQHYLISGIEKVANTGAVQRSAAAAPADAGNGKEKDGQ